MATIAIVTGGAIVNAAALGLSTYITHLLTGSSPEELEKERKRHDKAMEEYQKDYAEHEKRRLAYIDFMNKRKSDADQASENISETDEAMRLYNQIGDPPKFSDYYRPNEDQRMAQMVFVAVGMLILVYIVSKWVR